MRIKKFPILLSIFVVLLCWFSYKINDYPAEATDPVATIIYDMIPPHEGKPHGVNYDWASGPRIGMGNNPKGFKALIAWGQLYEDSQGNPATNSRVQISNIKAYMLSKRDGKWHLLQRSRKVEGAAYREDYVGDINKPADIRYESDGSISVKAGQGYNFHFWSPTGRVQIDPNDVAGIFTTVQARLVIDNPQKPDDRSKARYLLSMGGDYWLDLSAQWDNWTTNGDIGIGKFKYVTTKWQAFNMTNLSPTEIRQNPPPMEIPRARSSD
jgi:hypothetical protein